MDFIREILSNPQVTFDPLNFVAIIVTVLASLYTYRHGIHSAVFRERHDKLIFPLFDILEPVLYQDDYDRLLPMALKIIKNNKNLADGRLLELFYLCTDNPSKENFYYLCDYINKAYDRSCRRLGLKTRSNAYRLNRKQYRNNVHCAFYVIRSAVSLIFFFAMMISSVVFGIAFLYVIYQFSTLTIKIFLLLLCAFICLTVVICTRSFF